MIKIYKASAGSGKTYNLALEYIRLIVTSDSPDAYRHVLAVTFTNKATAEMKRRILKELYTLAKDPGSSKYTKELVPSSLQDVETLREKAARQLSLILHDYSAFAVSTIDKFFQQTLRAFSREIGQFSTYQVQLNREALVTESVDSVLDSLEEGDSQLLEWLTEGVKKDLAGSGKYHLEDRLTAMASSLKDIPEDGILTSRSELRKLGESCERVDKEFRAKVQAAARAVMDVLERHAVLPELTSRKWLVPIRDYAEGMLIEKPKPGFLNAAADSDKWFKKADSQKLLSELGGDLDAPLSDFIAMFDAPYREFNTAVILKKQIYSLGAARELREAMVRIQKEKNVLSLDDSNAILKGIIDGTDAPFIYEKLGVRFNDFLLDEFQDTSLVQWQNFLPLLKESQAGGNDSLVVGDVKQSIYRWRGSDWHLLDEGVAKEFRPSDIFEKPLGENYRTCKSIVEFNNEFFQFAAAQLGVSRIYADVVQTPCFNNPSDGSVEVCFPEDQMEEILRTIDELRSRGALYRDITILVRANADGSEIARCLVENSIPVVSDDSLFVKSSVTVRRLVSQLALVENPGEGDGNYVAGYLAGAMDIGTPSLYHSLPALAETLLREIRDAYPEVFKAEIPYIQSFMDYLMDWCQSGGNNLGAFLRDWKDADPKIASPDSGDAVRIMTIHKAKGLEFPFVIFPFAEKVTLYKASDEWCEPELKDTALEESAGKLFRVHLDSRSEDSLFSDSYNRELELQAIDNINVFYVALTRPVYGIKIIAQPKGLAAILKQYTDVHGLVYGTPFDFKSLVREALPYQTIAPGYPSFGAGAGDRLRFSPEAMDYFGEDDTFGPEASTRIRGNVLHGILASVRTPEDIGPAVEAAVSDGLLPEKLKEETKELLCSRIESVSERGWFADDAGVYSEEPVFTSTGMELRPDRVVVRPDGSVDVIDYKFGKPQNKYLRQVGNYVSIYKSLGYADVKGFIWYFADGNIVQLQDFSLSL